MIENNKKLKGKIKLIGIGVKDDIHYINSFKKQFKVQFPLFTDEEREIHELVGEPPTPFFIGVQLKKNKKGDVFYTHLGRIPPPDKFINLIIKETGLK
ncbi:MAG: hypothetical protein SVY10_13025 [Thermodesulfobacteriota bacterium]|nr:hypothetical protein [Thermodesulfobacteriota bacterium]